MIEQRWHVMVARRVGKQHFVCRKCGWEADLAGAIAHAVANQERVV